MFTGIVEMQAQVRSCEGGVLVLDPPQPEDLHWVIGESVAVNGCCLTLVSSTEGLRFDLSPETLLRTSLGQLIRGTRVNLERALLAGGRFGGHVVQGHVDTTGTLVSITPAENSSIFRFQAPAEFDRYLIDKGSIAVEGVSLTVVQPNDGAFDVWVIPQTLRETTLGTLKPGVPVNMEFDVLAKYVEKLVSGQSRAR